MDLVFALLAGVSVGAIAISAISAGIVKKYDPNQILYWHLNRKGDVEGYSEARRESRILFSQKYDRYGRGIINGIMYRGTLRQAKSELKNYLQLERIIMRAKASGEDSIQTSLLDSRIARLNENNLSKEEQERYFRIYKEVMDQSRDVLYGKAHDPEPGLVASYQSEVRARILNGIFKGQTDHEIILFCLKTRFVDY